MDLFKACIQGYTDHIFDMQLLGVQTGYWAGYYSRAKKPKQVKTVIDGLLRNRQRDEKRSAKGVQAPAVDVEGFLAMEEKFKSRQQQQKSKQ